MAEGRQERLRVAYRLRRAADFRRVFREGARVQGRLLGLVGARGRSQSLRLGLAAGRRLGGAVVRNRAKRLIRESARRGRRDLPLDVVAIPKPALLTCGLADVASEYRLLLERLRRRLESRREGAAPASD